MYASNSTACRTVHVTCILSKLSNVSGSRSKLIKGAIPVPLASNHKSPPNSKFASISVPVGLSPTFSVSPFLICCSLLVSGPSGT